MKVRKSIILCLWSVLSEPLIVLSQHIPLKDHTTRQYFAIESNETLSRLGEIHPNWQYEHDVRGLLNHYVFSKEVLSLGKRSSLEELQENNDDHILSVHDLSPRNDLFKRLPIPAPPVDSSLLPIKEAEDKLSINDPLFERQWHLINPSFPGSDINVVDLWYNNITGAGVVAAIVDDGLDYENEDLKDNFCAEGSWDFNDNTNLPKPRLADDYHGTRCAGEIAAKKGNDFCGVGVGYNAKISGIRILSGEITTEDEAASLIYGLDTNDIYSCSWGPADDGRHLQGPSDLVKKALVKGVTEGRGSKGAIYVFASGNGGARGDNCNYDGYTNSIYSITIGAIDHKDLHPPYSESCSAVMAVTYSSGSGEYIHSSDINGKCSDSHGGTSAAAPLAAGVYTLLLEANPSLSWRDVQYLSILSAVGLEKNSDGDWQDSAMGKKYSHRYGFGKIDAYKLVEMAKTWVNVNPQTWYYLPTLYVSKSTNSTEETLESAINISQESLKEGNFKRTEHVTVTVDVDTDFRGTTTVDLISPAGIVSKLGVVRSRDDSSGGFKGWTFMSVAHWGESGAGEWKIKVKTTVNGHKINFHSWRLKLFGESIDPSKTETFVFGNDKEEVEPATTEGSISASSTGTGSTSSTGTGFTATTDTGSTATTGTGSTATTSLGVESSAAATSITAITDPDSDPNTPKKLSSPNQAMHYFLTIFLIGAIFMVLYFMFFMKSRRRIRRSRAETYEFDIIDTDSEYDSTLDNGASGIIEPGEAEDFDFDLSDEDHLASLSSSENGDAEHTIDSVLTNENPFSDPITQDPPKDSSEETDSNGLQGP
ncbi:hypothetical protein SEUBUCD646_0N00960 [Saccharomyces eubayanus]|nr:hypothetical protein SEUBUCD646_0N00960 [Saccharomyces eubayanus]